MQGFLKIAGDLSRWNIYRKAACVSDVTEMFIRPFLIPLGLSTR